MLKTPSFHGRYLRNQTGRLLTRTVLVKDNDVESALKILNGIVAKEGLLARWKITRRSVRNVMNASSQMGREGVFPVCKDILVPRMKLL